MQNLRQDLESVKQREKTLEKEKAFEELLRLHPDFNDLKTDEKFLNWLDEQPEQISDGIYKNNTDAKWAGRIISFTNPRQESQPRNQPDQENLICNDSRKTTTKRSCNKRYN